MDRRRGESELPYAAADARAERSTTGGDRGETGEEGRRLSVDLALPVDVVVLPDVAALGRATLARLRGPVVAISGGATYEALLPHWSGEAVRSLRFLPVDERRVGLSEPGSNWMRTITLLLDPNGLPGQARHWSLEPAEFLGIVRALCGAAEPALPAIDQVWLGMGEDGHTASIFPRGPELEELSSPVLLTRSPKPPHERITLGLAAIRAARDLCVVVAGAAKGPVLRRALEGDRALPVARALEGRATRATVFVDAACADAGWGDQRRR